MVEVEKQTEQFYKSVLELLQDGPPFLIGGTFAVQQFVPLARSTKDLDLFCKAGDYSKILTLAKGAGFETSIKYEKWLAKITKDDQLVDVIFSSSSEANPVDDSWFEHSRPAELFNFKVRVIAPEELIWCKIFIQDRTRYDGADVNHLILHQGKNLDWHRLLQRMDRHWELLLAALINYRFVFPSERDIVPSWLTDELIGRLKAQSEIPPPQDKLCRGPLLSIGDYLIDINEGGFTF